MKVLHVVIGGDFAGGQLVARTLVRGARANGHDAAIAAPRNGPFTDAVRDEGVAVHLIDVSRSYKLDGLLAMRRLIRRNTFDLVHTHGDLASNVLSRVAARTSGVPVVSHVHAATTVRSLPVVSQAYHSIDLATARLCARLIAVSDATRAAAIAQGVPAASIVTVHNGFDPPATSPAPAELGLTGLRVLACVGRVEPMKGQADLIEALALLPRDVAVLFVGPDVAGHRAQLEGLALERGVSDRVHFTGQRPDVLAILAAAEIAVLPSWSEGLPMVPLEAMAVRKPVVATNVGGVAEVVIDGETGLLVPPRSPAALGAALGMLLDDSGRATAYGISGRVRLEAHFSEAAMVERVLEIELEAIG